MVKTTKDEVIDGRYIDILIQNKKTGELTAIKDKYNGAMRSPP